MVKPKAGKKHKYARNHCTKCNKWGHETADCRSDLSSKTRAKGNPSDNPPSDKRKKNPYLSREDFFAKREREKQNKAYDAYVTDMVDEHSED